MNEIRVVEDRAVVLMTLTQGQTTIFDLADLPLLGQIRWWAQWMENGRQFYATGKPRAADGSYRIMQMQRFLLQPIAGMQADHINRNTLDNRRSNLRIVTRAENKRNSNLYRSNSSGFVGVYKASRSERWQASITIDGKNTHLGMFLTAEEAALARDRKAIELYGAHARLNFPDIHL